ncbi:MAG: LLM class flavin-dependent oxidoreductase [Myxococcales bacterium]|nr:LLM class flavin-dependent oxidoreductase [Myxococcales bacterium]
MKFDVFVLPAVPGTLEDRVRLKPIGRDTERYQQMLDELRKIAIFCDGHGMDAFSMTEHHLHTEGGEVSVNPCLIFADLAARTKRLHFAPMSIVLPAADPIRVAEDVAILDQLTKGRVEVAFARGYQKRWADILGQFNELKAATMDGSATDEQNRDVYEEKLEIVMKAWTQDAWDHKGHYYQVPYPYEEGIKPWAGAEWTRLYGSPGEVDAEGTVRKVGVCPAPYQKPHPPIWAPFSVSEKTMVYCAERGILPWIFHSEPEKFIHYCTLYRDVAAKNGHDFKLGQNIGAVRACTIGKTYDEAFKLACETTGHLYYTYWALFGFLEPFRRPGDSDVRPLNFKDEVEVTQRLVEGGYQLIGTVDDVKRQMEKLAKCHSNGQLDWFSWNFFYQGFSDWAEQERQLELFCTKIMPEFR